ncbi:chymotrypsin-2 [Microplitis demolitor]|uniref:chymotrypsin-2 n=1 Tax=Microplitis demolitor TaxID=69319 RepID=UPI00235B5E66|nr:chymotrypsin-2 [Microplitis demolitor]
MKLFKNRIFISFILITCHVTNLVKSQTRVVGGQNSSDGEFPYIVSIRFRNIHVCGGTIVSNRYILSAAHCLVSEFQFSGPISEHLQKIYLNIFDHHECTREWKYINNGHICISTSIGRGSCVGDSGGPILANHYQIGIISFGQLCAGGKPDVTTKVFHYLDWINSYISY